MILAWISGEKILAECQKTSPPAYWGPISLLGPKKMHLHFSGSHKELGLFTRFLCWWSFGFFILWRDYLSVRKPRSDICHLDSGLLTGFCTCYKDYESLYLGYAVSASWNLGDFNIVFLADFYRLRCEASRASVKATSVTCSTGASTTISVTRVVSPRFGSKELTY